MASATASVARFLACAIAAALLAPAAEAMAGTIDLYLQNASLDRNSQRSASNVAYFGVYYLGTPPRKFLGCVDTGSSDVWVPSSACTSTVCRSHDQYDPSLSSTAQNTSRFPVSIQYGTGTVSVVLTYDTMTLANVTITDQGFGVATSLSYDFATVSCDGLVGLGFQSLSSTGTVPPFLNAVRENALNQNLFAIWLSPDPGVEPAGKMTMGSIDSARYSGQLTYIDVTRTAYWQVVLNQITVGSSNAQIATRAAILDSGTTAIVMSTADANRVNALLPGATYWADMLSWNVTCNIAQLPMITFQLGGQPFALPPRLYVQLLTDMNGVSLGVCTSAIVGGGSSSASGPLAVLGTNFLRAWYSVYEVNPGAGTARVGLAPGTGKSGVSAGGRRLMADEAEAEKPLFSMPLHSLAQPKQWGTGQPGNRRLAEGAVAQEQAQGQGQGQAEPQLFSRSAASLGHNKWARK